MTFLWNDVAITQLRTENIALKSQLSDIVSKGNEMEQYSGMDNLVINGLKTSAADVAGADVVASSSTSLQKQFIDVCNNDLHISVMFCSLKSKVVSNKIDKP